MNELRHYGIKGQKWGVRRFENSDGTLTPEGKKRYSKASLEVSSKTVIDNWNGKEFPITTHTFKKQTGSEKSRSSVDALAENKDYESARKFDLVGEQALAAYEKDGKEAAQKILSKQMKNYSYEYVISDENEDAIYPGQRWVTYALTVFGNSKVYGSYGENGYSDDQYFNNRK